MVTYVFLACGESKVVKVSTAGRIMVKSSVVSQSAFLQSMRFAQRSKMVIPLRSVFSVFSLCVSTVLFLHGCVDVDTSPSLSFPHRAQLNAD